MTPLPVVAVERLPDALEDRTRIYLQPVGLALFAGADRPADAPAPRCLAGGPWGFARCRVHLRGPERIETLVAGVAEIEAWAGGLAAGPAVRVDQLLERLSAPRPLAAAKGTDGPTALMGVVNVTPDSFSDGGAYLDPARAEAQLRRLVAEGAAIVDVGGESTRPGAAPVAPEEEAARLAPLLARLAAEPTLLGGARLSIDTRHAAVMRAGLAAGASIINDVSALVDDPDSLNLAAESQASVVLMHRRAAPGYAAAALDVFDFLEGRVAACEAAGIGRERLIVDPGIGFGKGSADTVQILRALALYHGLGCPILVGASRKGLTGALDRAYPPDQRLPGSLAVALHAASLGVQILRVHDVAATDQALRVWRLLAGAIPPAA